MCRYVPRESLAAGSGPANIGPYQHDRGTRIPASRIHFVFFVLLWRLRHFLFSRVRVSSAFLPLLRSVSPEFSRLLGSFATFVCSLGCQCWALGMRDGFVFLRLSPARSPSVLSLLHTPLSAARFPLPPNRSATPLTASLPISVSLAFPRLSRSRVLLTRTRFSSLLSSIRAPGYTTDSHPPQGKGYPGERGRSGRGRRKL